MTHEASRPSSWPRTAIHVAALFVIGLALRLGVWSHVRDDPTFQVPVGDMKGNHEFAVQVLEGSLPSVSYYKAPLYGLFLAGVYAVAGVDTDIARLVQIALTSLIPVVTYLIARRFFGPGVGLLAGLLAAVYWTFLFFSIELLDTGPASLLYLLLAYALISLDDRRWTSWIVAGALLGLAAITRPNILAFAPVLAILAFYLLYRRTPPIAPAQPDAASPVARSRLRIPALCVLALTAACCAVVLPVTLRNRIVGGEWVLIGAYGGLNLYVANSPYSDSKDGPLLVPERYLTAPNPIDHDAPEPWARNCLNYNVALRVGESVLGRRPTPGEFSSILADMAVDYVWNNPAWFLKHAFMRVCWLFNAYEFQSNRDLYDLRRSSWLLHAASYVHYGILCPLALVGIGFALSAPRLRTHAMAYYLAMILSLALPAVAFIINCRFRTPLVHLLVPFAAYGLVRTAIYLIAANPWPRRLGLLAVLAALAVFSNANLFDYRSHGTAHFKAQYLGACERAGRDDLLPHAYDRLERALDEEMIDLKPGNTSLMLEYGPYMTRLFVHYLQRGDLPKAIRYGRLMIARERIDPTIYLAYVNLLLKQDLTDQARTALHVLERRCLPEHPALVARAHLAYGFQCRRPASVARAASLIQDALRRTPGDCDLQRLLQTAQQALDRSKPTTSATADSQPPATKESAP